MSETKEISLRYNLMLALKKTFDGRSVLALKSVTCFLGLQTWRHQIIYKYP